MTGICKQRRTNTGYEKGRCPLRSEDEDTAHRLLKCLETREEILIRKWFMFNEGVAYTNITNFTDLQS